MSGMAILDVAIGIIFMFLLLALIVSVVQESLASALKWRAENLYKAIENLLKDEQDKGLVVDLYSHPLIQSLYRKALAGGGAGSQEGAADRDPETFFKEHARRLPSYIPSRSFALALIDVLRGKAELSQAVGADTVLAEAKDAVAKLPEGGLRRSLMLLVADAKDAGDKADAQAKKASERIEGWFNDSMARSAGWYKRKAQVVSLVISLLVTLVANADAVHVGTQLWRDSNLRTTVVAAAAGFQDRQEGSGGDETLDELVGELSAAQFPIGWYAPDEGYSLCPRPLTDGGCDLGGGGFLALLLGWIVTAFAISLGATFWFDVLGKALQIRGSGGKILAETGQAEIKPARKGGKG